MPSRPYVDHGGQVLAVLAPQLGQEPAAFLHVDQALGVVVPPLDLVAQRARQVRQLDGGRGQARVVALEGLAAGQRAAGTTEQVEGPALAAGVDELHGTERRVAVGRGVRQAILLPAERRLLLGVLEMGGADLLDLVAQDVGLAGPLLGVAPQARQRLVERVAAGSGWPEPG